MRIELKYPDIPLLTNDEPLAEQDYTMTRIPKVKREIKELADVHDELLDRLQQVKNELLKRQQHDDTRRSNSRTTPRTKDAAAGVANNPRNK